MFFKIRALKNLQILIGNSGIPATLLKETPHMCFPKNIAKFLRTDFFIEHLRWLLLPQSFCSYCFLAWFSPLARTLEDLRSSKNA